jgi:hypothetical protein
VDKRSIPIASHKHLMMTSCDHEKMLASQRVVFLELTNRCNGFFQYAHRAGERLGGMRSLHMGH